MALKLTCPACAAVFGLMDDRRGKKAFCPKCGQALVVTGAGVAKRSEGDAAEARRTRGFPWLPLALALVLTTLAILVGLFILRHRESPHGQQVARKDGNQTPPEQNPADREPAAGADKLRKLSPAGGTAKVAPPQDQHQASTEDTKPPAQTTADQRKPGPTDTIQTTAPLLGGRVLALTGDGKTLASGRPYGRDDIDLWDVASGQKKAGMSHVVGGLCSVAFLPDGNTLLSGHDDGSSQGALYFWDVASCQKKATITTPGMASFALSPDGKTVAGGGTASLWFMDVASGKSRSHIFGAEETSEPSQQAFSPDSKTVVSADLIGGLQFWDVATCKLARTFPCKGTFAVAFRPDGGMVAAVGTAVGLWDVASGRQIQTLRDSTPLVAAAFSPDGKTLATGGGPNTWDDVKKQDVFDRGGELKLWDVASGKCVATLPGHTDRVNAVVFSPDGKTLISQSLKDIKSWDVTQAQCLKTFGR